MGGTMPSKSLTQFSVDRLGCVPSLFDMRQNCCGGNEDNGDLLQKVPCMHRFTQYPQLCSRPPWTISGCSRASLFNLLWGHSCFLLGPGAHTLLFALFKSLFHQSCVRSGGSMVGLMLPSSKRAYATLRSAASGAPAPAAVHC